MCPESVPYIGQSRGRCEELIAQFAGMTTPYTAHRMAGELAGGTGVHRQCRDLLPESKGEQLSGTGGIGKSAVAVHFAKEYRDHFPDGIIGLRVDGKEKE